MALLREAGLAAIDLTGESWRYRGDGLQYDESDLVSSAGIFARAHTLAQDESTERFLRRFEDDPSMREIVSGARAFVEGFEAADPAVASVRAIAAEWASGADSTSARPLGGYRPMFDHLHHACVAAGVGLHLSTIVRRIAWQKGSASINVTDGAGRAQTIEARAVIITLPVGVLRHEGESAVIFDPPLQSKREALASLEMGHVVKAMLWFKTAFWEQVQDERLHDAGFFRCEGGPFAAFWTQVPVRSELIAAWAGGPKATALAGVPQPQIVERALEEFGTMLGEPERARREFEGGTMHDWRDDPFARGAYSYVAVGGGDARARLAAPLDGTLFFAGEATSTDGQGGTVNGALEAGERAAAEVARALDA
jgi:monoamine oxidase